MNLGSKEDECVPRVIIRKEIITITPTTLKPSPTYVQLLPGVNYVNKRRLCTPCNEMATNRSISRGHGILYQDVSITWGEGRVCFCLALQIKWET